MILAIIESKSAGMVSPSPTPVSTRMPGPEGRSSSAIRPGDGAKSRSGSSAFSRASTACPRSDRLRSLEPAPGRHVQLRLDQVQVRRRLGDRVLDLQPGVDLEEGERPLSRVVEELDSSGADVPHRDGQLLRGRLELVGLALVEKRRRRLLDHLLVAPLHGAVADADRPRRAVTVADQLDLDVPCPGHQALEEDHAAAERPLGLVAGALVGVLELGGRVDLADAPATPTGRGLEHERVADAFGSGQRTLQRVDAASAPRRDRHTDLLRQELGADLVAQPAHRVGARTDEGHAEALAQVSERGVLRDESPSHPDRVCRALDQHPLEDGEVDVGPRRSRTQRVGLVGLPREHRRTFLVRVERDRLDRRHTTVRVQVADGVDQPHRRLAAIHDRHSSEHPGASGLDGPLSESSSRDCHDPEATAARTWSPPCPIGWAVRTRCLDTDRTSHL